jgi:serine/threonine-protein kinase
VDTAPDGTVYLGGDAVPVDPDDPRWEDEAPGGLVIARLGSDGAIEVVAGPGYVNTDITGEGDDARDVHLISGPTAIDNEGNVYVTDVDDGTLGRVSPDGIFEFIVGPETDREGPDRGGDVDTIASLRGFDIAVDDDGTVYFSGYITHQVLAIPADEDEPATAVAGEIAEPGARGDGGPAVDALLETPYGVAVAEDGTIFIGDAGNARIRRVTPDGIIDTVAGGGTRRAPSGPALELRLGEVGDVDVDSDGNVYFLEGRSVIRKLSPQGRLTTFAGGGSQEPEVGTRATDVDLGGTSTIAVGPDGTVYFADERLFEISPDGTIAEITTFP